MALEPEHLPVLGRLRDLQPHPSGDRCHCGLAAEDGGGDGHRYLGPEVVAITFERGMRPNPHSQIEVTGRATVGA